MTVPLPAAIVADPHRVYAQLREEGAVHRFLLPDGATAWIVTRYAEARKALADPRLSLNKTHATAGVWKGFGLPPALDANLLNMDPPDHTRLRRLVSAAFTPRRTEALRPRLESVAEALIAPVAEAGHGDLVATFAPLPVTVICDLLGVPRERRPELRNWAGIMLAPPPDDPAAAGRAVLEVQAFLVSLIRQKRGEPGDDLLSALIAARDDDDRLSEDELTSLAFLTLIAGYENSVNLIGLSLFTLLRHPAQWQALRDDPALLPGAVRELMRYEPPAPVALRRFATEDIEIGGVLVPAGDTVLVSIAAADRDPAQWPAPDELDLHRDTAAQLSLGYGIHYCLGAPLARLEAEVAIAAVLRRLPVLELTGEPVWRPSFRSRALRSLPVRVPGPADRQEHPTG
ncbi:cytochrome P450 [Actinoplanes sp. N902-109]|uniref:cytochrome P450 family protein n=1 Tax=Actinoplanes sp. (strain N902-109) TaxID=649831 RepID=UPI0003295114|nr:cytochrome P450 [Actinoplanes sp. N902-109]AGL18903.1 putative cytochrome P450 [Actinoplanes sp. N902-109]